MNKINSLLREAVLKTNSNPILGEIYKFFYKVALRAFCFSLSRITNVIAIYLQRGALTFYDKEDKNEMRYIYHRKKEFIYGSSDIDIVVVIRNLLPLEELKTLKRIARIHFLLKKIFPVLSYPDIFNLSEINHWICRGDYKGFEAKNWKLIYGKEIKSQSYSFDRERFIIDCLKEGYGWCFHGNFYGLIFNGSGRSHLKSLQPISKYLSRTIRCVAYALKNLSDIEGQEISTRIFNKTDISNQARRLKHYSFSSGEQDGEIIKTFSYLTTLFTRACEVVSANIKNEIKSRAQFLHPLTITDLNVPLGTLRFIENRAREFAGEVYSELGSSAVSIVLGSRNCGASYGFKLYIILEDNLSKEAIEKSVCAIKKLYWGYKELFYSGYFLWNERPLIMQKSTFSFLLDFKIFPGSELLESFYLVKHGLVLNGEDMLRGGARVNFLHYNSAIISSIPGKFKEIRWISGNAYMSRFGSDRTMPFILSRNIIDYVCGIMPCLVLLLQFGIVATTPFEIVQEYCGSFPGGSSAKWLKDFFDKYDTLPVEEVRRLDPRRLADESYCFLTEQVRRIDALLNTNVHFV